MILVTSRQIYADFLTVRRCSLKRPLLLLLSTSVFFSCFSQASSHIKIIETGKITMTGNRQTETDNPQKRIQAFSEKVTVTSPIVLTGTRKTSP
jgi:hypothetical protein